MSLSSADLPSDPDALRAFALACQSELAQTTAELQAAKLAVQLRTLEIEKLKFQIAKLRRMQFGRSSERLTRQIEQLELRLEELEAGEAEEITKAATEDRPLPIREGTGQSVSRCRTICRVRRPCTSQSTTAPAPVQPAAAKWLGSAKTSPRSSTMSRAGSE
jgi:Transposase C of IS166 homeodomain